MKKVVWGTGFNASRFSKLKIDEIDFFIDNDITKNHSRFLDKEVIHPSEITNWKDIYLYIPERFAEEILLQIEKYCDSGVEYELYGVYVHDIRTALENDLKRCIKRLERMVFPPNTYLVMGEQIGGDKWGIFLKQFCKNNPCTIMDVFYDKNECPNEEVELPLIFLGRNYFCADEINEVVDLDSEYLDSCLQFMEDCQCDEKVSRVIVKLLVEYVTILLDTVKPVGVITFSRVDVSTQILEIQCQNRRIPLLSEHLGIFPGTLLIDVDGEIGGSIPSTYSNEFKSLWVSEEEIEIAKKIWDRQYKERLNRKRQPKKYFGDWVSKITKERPTIFYAAMSDAHSFMIPYTDKTARNVSPLFKTSVEAGTYIADICKSNNWNFIYKPHPDYIREEQISQLPDNTIYIEKADINEIIDASDVVVTIASNTSYDAMMRYKPVVLLGHNWCKNQGCAYEVAEKSDIEKTMIEAINEGFTCSMKSAFLENIARLCKYYLFDDLSERDIRYGKAMPANFEDFFELKKICIEIRKKHENSSNYAD